MEDSRKKMKQEKPNNIQSLIKHYGFGEKVMKLVELYSPDRISQVNPASMQKRWAIDLETGWDLNYIKQRNEVVHLVKREKPTLIIGSPPCTKMSTL